MDFKAYAGLTLAVAGSVHEFDTILPHSGEWQSTLYSLRWARINVKWSNTLRNHTRIIELSGNPLILTNSRGTSRSVV